jgi:hypothetical protein
MKVRQLIAVALLTVAFGAMGAVEMDKLQVLRDAPKGRGVWQVETLSASKDVPAEARKVRACFDIRSEVVRPNANVAPNLCTQSLLRESESTAVVALKCGNDEPTEVTITRNGPGALTVERRAQGKAKGAQNSAIKYTYRSACRDGVAMYLDKDHPTCKEMQSQATLQKVNGHDPLCSNAAAEDLAACDAAMEARRKQRAEFLQKTVMCD